MEKVLMLRAFSKKYIKEGTVIITEDTKAIFLIGSLFK